MARTGSALVLYDARAADPEATAVVGFLGGHKGRTREAYELDLRQFARWCQHRGQRLFDVTRVDIERFARDLEQSGRAPATISRRLATITGLYRFAEEEGLRTTRWRRCWHSTDYECPKR
jgi:site-specific recombinase XerD